MTVIEVMLLLFVGGVLAWLSQRWHSHWPKWIALITCVLSSVLMLPLYYQESTTVLSLAGAPSYWIEYVQYSWIPRFGISLIFALDGLSLMMVSLTLFLGFVAILSSWTEISERPGFFQFNLL